MSITWQDLAFRIESDLAHEVAKAWSWLLPEPWEPIICSTVAGIFLTIPTGEVIWLDTATALLEQVAESREQFEGLVKSSPAHVDEWFLPPLVDRLHAAGKRPKDGECYGFIILPVFAEGKYDTDNMVVVPVREQLIGIANIHRQLSELPNGATVQVKVTD